MKSDRELPSYYRERHAKRTKVQATASIRHGDWYSVEVRIRDVSQRGFMAECADPVGIGSYVALDVPGIGAVRRSDGRRVGRSVSVRVDLGGCRFIKKKKHT